LALGRSFSKLAVKILLAATLALSLSAPDRAVAENHAGVLNIENYKGKVVYLDFWAAWCVPCRASFPWMRKMQKRYGKDGLKMVTVNVDRDTALAKKFLKDHGANSLNVIYDPDGKLAERFDLQGMPSSFIFNRNGKLVYSHIGFHVKECEEYETKIKEVLGK
jgi:thiol-disulfide isomerase/thioredoxin